MKVKELIEELSKLDIELDVLVHGYEGGHDYVDAIKTSNFLKDYHDLWYYGRHEEILNSDIVDDTVKQSYENFTGVVLYTKKRNDNI